LRSYYRPDAFPIHLLRKDLPNSSGTSISYYAQVFDKTSQNIWVVDRANPKKLISVSLDGERSDLLLEKVIHDFRPDTKGNGFLTVNGSGATLWDRQGKIVQEYPYPGASFATMSPDGERIMVAGGYEGAALVMNRQGEVLTRLCCHGNTIVHGDFAAGDSGIISTAGNKETRVWNATGKLQYKIEHGDYVTSATISPNGEFFATTTWDSRVQVWWLKTGKSLKNLPGHSSRVYSANFSPDGQQLVTASWDGTVRVWDARSMSTEVLLTLPTVESQNVVIWSPNGNWLVASGSKTVTLWNVTTTKYLSTDFRSRSQMNAEQEMFYPFRLEGSYRDVSVIRNGQRFFSFEIPFEDRIFYGNFAQEGRFIDTTGQRRFPFSPEVIRDLVYSQKRFGTMERMSEK
jgi:WD40 repeat protein